MPKQKKPTKAEKTLPYQVVINPPIPKPGPDGNTPLAEKMIVRSRRRAKLC